MIHFKHSLDDACRLLRDFASSRGIGGIELYVRQDGRVDIRIGGGNIIHADLLEGGAHPLPSVALCAGAK